jgi:hypothetical protein
MNTTTTTTTTTVWELSFIRQFSSFARSGNVVGLFPPTPRGELRMKPYLKVSLTPLDWGWIVWFLVEWVHAMAIEKSFGVKYQFPAEKRPKSRLVSWENVNLPRISDSDTQANIGSAKFAILMRLLLEIELAPVTLLSDIFFLHSRLFRLIVKLSGHIYINPGVDR